MVHRAKWKMMIMVFGENNLTEAKLDFLISGKKDYICHMDNFLKELCIVSATLS